MQNRPSASVISVSQLASQLRQTLEQGFPATVVVSGEISNFSAPSSGHWYFTLKDDRAQIRCAMFRNRNQLVRFRPRNGEQVHLYCRISYYEPRGDVQVLGEYMEPAGQGGLQLAFEQLKARLMEEGLFARERKRPLPVAPARIAVITSATGAAVRDILTVLQRRSPATEVDLYPVPVQGSEAAPAIERALALANRLADTEVIILGRGGGSLEDLWPFNEERVARAIAASALPVISAVGHETDITIADYVADKRAPTPSAAAELAVPDQQVHAGQLAIIEQRLHTSVRRHLRFYQQRLGGLRERLRQPERQWQRQSQRLDELSLRLQRLMRQRLEQQQQTTTALSLRLEQQSPERRLARGRQQLTELDSRLHSTLQRKLASLKPVLATLEARVQQQGGKLVESRRQQLQQWMKALHLVSPLATLERGYAIVQDGDGHVVHRAASLTPGQMIYTRLGEGQVESQVIRANTATTFANPERFESPNDEQASAEENPKNSTAANSATSPLEQLSLDT